MCLPLSAVRVLGPPRTDTGCRGPRHRDDPRHQWSAEPAGREPAGREAEDSEDEEDGEKEGPPAAPAGHEEAERAKAAANRAFAAGRSEEALRLLDTAVALVPANAVYRSNRSAVHTALKQHEQARADAEAAADLDPGWAKAWGRVGLARFHLHDLEGSIAAYEKGLALAGGGKDRGLMEDGLARCRAKLKELEASGRHLFLAKKEPSAKANLRAQMQRLEEIKRKRDAGAGPVGAPRGQEAAALGKKKKTRKGLVSFDDEPSDE